VRVGALQHSPVLPLEDIVGAVLERRLLRGSRNPVAVALSGGGDSLALLLAAADWARNVRRDLMVLTLDHQLRPESAQWTQRCAAVAARLGLAFRALAWTGEKPSTGLPAAARRARHALLADAARSDGARAILMGHTADDGLEARLMRETGSTTPQPREWAPSPAWPEGRGVFLLRPMLRTRRADIRSWLRVRGETWIDDPANEDPTFARARARLALTDNAAPLIEDHAAPGLELAIACRPDARGGLEIDRAALRSVRPEALAHFISAACVCAAGTDRSPGREKAARLAIRLTADGDFIASLSGARIEAQPGLVRFRREPGEAERSGLKPLSLRAGETGVWDGRFEIAAERALEVRAMRRTTLPVAADGGGLLAIPLTHERLLAACGVIEREPA